MKKIINSFPHPIFIIFFFCLLVISGKSNANVYIMILLMGLSQAAMHSLLGIAGIVIILSTSNYKPSVPMYMISITGAVLMYISLIRFFTQPGADYNFNTFRQTLPLVLIIVFGILLTVFIIRQLLNMSKLRF